MSSRKRRLVTPQQPDEKRRTDRIVVDVGGTRFTTSASTLTAGSEYFERLLSPRWCAEPPEEIFLDRDPEPFAILLTYMRTGLLELSKDDLSMARRVMIEAEFLGMVGLIDSVKAKAIKNTGWEGTDWEGTDADAVKYFDTHKGSFDAAIRNGILPAKFFDADDTPEPPPKIVQMLPAPPGTRAEIHFDDEDEPEADYSEWFDVLCFVRYDKPKWLNGDNFFSALDAYVAHHPYDGEPRLASEAYGRAVTKYIFHLPRNDVTDTPEGVLDAKDRITEIPEGVLLAEYWRDKDDHSAGYHSHPVRTVRGNLNRDGCTPVELVPNDSGTVRWVPLSSYDNFKGFRGGG